MNSYGSLCITLLVVLSILCNNQQVISFHLNSLQYANKIFSNTINVQIKNEVIKGSYHGRSILKAVWKDSVVSIIIPASKERTYTLFSSLDQHPSW